MAYMFQEVFTLTLGKSKCIQSIMHNEKNVTIMMKIKKMTENYWAVLLFKKKFYCVLRVKLKGIINVKKV